ADQTVHDDYLSRMGPLRDVTVVVFNQIDLLRPEDAQRCVADLARLVEADGLPGIPVVPTSARTGAGVNGLRTLLEKAIAGRHAPVAGLEGELDEAVDELIPLVRTEQSAPVDDPLDRAAVAGFADELADAASVPAVAAEAARVYTRRATVPGWPFERPGAKGPVDSKVPPADPAAVAVARGRPGLGGRAGLAPPGAGESHPAQPRATAR